MAAPAPKPKRSVARRILRAILFVFAGLFALALLAIAVLHTSFAQDRIRAAARDAIAKNVRGEVAIGKLSFALFGDLEIGGVDVRDRSGDEVIALDDLTIAPDWSELLHGRAALDLVRIRGVRLHLVKKEGGGSNLDDLFEPPPTSSEPTEPEAKQEERFGVKQIAIEDVSVRVDQPDGTRLDVTNVALDASVDATPAEKTIALEVKKIGANVGIDKGQGGLKAAVRDLSTGLTVALEHGVGRATLHPTTATIAITPPGAGEKTIPFSIGALVFDLDGATVKGSLDALVAGALALASIDVSAAKDDRGERSADAVGMHLDAAKLNAILGGATLASDVDVELHAKAKGDDLELRGDVKTAGGALDARGTLGADHGATTFDVTLSATGLVTSKLLASSANVLPLECERAEVSFRGRGDSKETLRGDAKVSMSKMRARGVPIDAVDVDARVDEGAVKIRALDVEALGQHASLTGDVDTTKKTLDVTLALDGDPAVAIAALRTAGVPVKVELPRGALVLPKGSLKVHARGAIEGEMKVDVDAPAIAVASSRASLHARATLEDRQPRDVDATFAIDGLELAKAAAMRGKETPVDGTLSGRVHVFGPVASPSAELAFEVRELRARLGDGHLPVEGAISLTGRASPRDAHVELRAKRTTDDAILASLDADVPLAGEAIDRARPLSIRVQVPRRTFADFVATVPLPEAMTAQMTKGEAALAIDVAGTIDHPRASLDLDLRAKALGGKEQRAHVAGTFEAAPEPRGDLDVDLWLDDALQRTANAKIAARASSKRDVAWSADVDVPPLALASVPAPPEKLGELRAIGGEAVAHLAFHGSLDDAFGDAKLALSGAEIGDGAPLDARASLALGPDRCALDANVDVADAPLVTVRGGAAIGGRALVKRLRDHAAIDPALDVAIDVPKRAIASLASVRRALASIPGALDGHVAIGGTMLAPLAKGRIGASGVPTIDGGEAGAVFDVGADASAIAASFGVGATSADRRAVVVGARVDRSALAAFAAGGDLPIEASLRAEGVDLRTLAPRALVRDDRSELRGRLDSNLSAKVTLAREDGEVKLSKTSLGGALDLTNGVVPLPGTKREYRDVKLHVAAAESGLSDVVLSAIERDMDRANRSIEARGSLDMEQLAPKRASLDLHAKDWLLFGSKMLGRPDAPRGTLSIDAHVDAELDGPKKRVAAVVNDLEVLFPDRFEKAHQPEDVHAGDLFFVGADDVPIGRFPVPKREPKHEPVSTSGDDERGLDATITIKKARVLQSPIDLSPHGAIVVRVRPSGRIVRGKLDIDKGELSLAGKMHPLAHGKIVFDDAHPEGYLELAFARKVPNSAMRDISEASAGDAITITMTGPISDRKTVLGGAGSPGSLYDLLAMHAAGRLRYVSEPGMPASETAQFPAFDNVLALSFISVNLPHLLFLDHAEAWANPYDDRRSYGRLEHYDSERFSSDGKVRVEATKEPPKIGDSEAAIELDWVPRNTTRTRFGVGVRGGSRGGGGPAAFWEWSSED